MLIIAVQRLIFGGLSRLRVSEMSGLADVAIDVTLQEASIMTKIIYVNGGNAVDKVNDNSASWEGRGSGR